MNTLLTFEQLEALRRLDACILANAIETFRERLRNEGFMDNSVRCLFPRLQPMLGYAATIKIRGSAPPTADGRFAERTDWWDYIVSLPAPRVVVVEDVSSRPGLGSLVGAVHMNILRALNCVGVVTNGAVRDIPAADSAGFHFFAGSETVSHAYIHIVEIGNQVQVGGLKIKSGDLLHGDMHGVQSIPLDIAARIPVVAAKIAGTGANRFVSFARILTGKATRCNHQRTVLNEEHCNKSVYRLGIGGIGKLINTQLQLGGR